MQPRSSGRLPSIFLLPIVVFVLCFSGPTVSAQEGEFPQENVWTQATPSVVWCQDTGTTSPTTLEVHIVGRNDVSRVWLTNMGTTAEEGRGELYDDGSHGDAVAGDRVFTRAEFQLPCNRQYIAGRGGFQNWWGFLRVELTNGNPLENNYGMVVGMVDIDFQNAFPVQDLGDGLSATAYAFFIQDSNHEVMDAYPVTNVYCGTANFNAYRKLYSVLPDVFDFALVMPGMQIFRPSDLAENVPYEVNVANDVQHIGMDIFDRTAEFGSAGRLKAVVYHSFGDVSIVDHELGHAWGVNIGRSLDLMDVSNGTLMLGHWNDMADIQGQMGRYYFAEDGSIGHFADNGDGTWRLVANTEVEPYSPLELYLMGMIPPEQVPPIHILTDPNLTDPQRITAASYQTVTIDQIMQAEGGERVPSYAEAQKDFSLAFIVSQDAPFNDAAYAYFSLLSHSLMSRNPPRQHSSFAPFYWATGGRGTLDTRLPVEVGPADFLPGDATPTPEPADPAQPAMAATATVIPGGTTPAPTGRPPICGSLFAAGGLVLIPGALSLLRKRQRGTK